MWIESRTGIHHFEHDLVIFLVHRHVDRDVAFPV
jgi:hypothetical protein